MAEIERRVKRNIGLRGNSSQATLGELEAEARRLSRDWFPELRGGGSAMERAGAWLYAEAVWRGIDPAKESVVCLGNGAPSNWSQFGRHSSQRVEVLDWHHAVEHLWAAGKDRWTEDIAQAREWMEGRKQGVVGGTSGSGAGGSEEGAPEEQAAAAEVHYFETTQERMGYAEFWAQGYSIGSGTVESACKGVMGARLKQAGMCWTQAGAQAVLSLQPSCSVVVGRQFGPLPTRNSKSA